MAEIIDANLIIPWILWVILQWALLLAPAVVLRKYLGRPMSKRNAIGTGVAMAVFWTIVAVMIADELGIAPGPRGTAVKAFPIVMAAWISVWLLRKKSILGDDASLGMLDRIFKNAFPESDTPHLAPSPRQSSHSESTADEDAYYDLAFSELEGDQDLFKRDAATWARALVEADGDKNKANARYIRARVAARRDLLNAERYEADRLKEKGLKNTEIRIDESLIISWFFIIFGTLILILFILTFSSLLF